MRDLGKIAGLNMLILMIYMTIINHYNVPTLSIIVITIHVLTNLILAAIKFRKGNKTLGQAFMVSGGIVLLIGFSSCLAIIFT